MKATLVCLPAVLSAAIAAPSQAQETVEQRLQRLERENAEQARRMDVLADELEKRELGDLVAPLGSGTSGLGPAASKVYAAREGVSIGGYGEMIFKERQGGASTDELDLLRNVFYVGYKFDDTWVFNSETEFEHAVAADGADGEVAVEFAYLDGRICESTSLRAGLVNERHEPTTFPSANRPFVERVILPATWREPGAGAWGSVGPVDWRAYVIDGLDAMGFTDGGIRGGRQEGSEATAEDLAGVARADWHVCESLDLGASVYYGHAGQDQLQADVATTIFEGHAEFAWRSLAVRALYAQTKVEDVAALNSALGIVAAVNPEDSVGETMFGGYVEVAYDVWSAIQPGSQRSLEPFVRYELYDTQSEVPQGFASDPARDVEVFTFGVAYHPNANIVFKLDFNDFDNEAGNAVDQLDLSLGFTY